MAYYINYFHDNTDFSPMYAIASMCLNLLFKKKH